MMWKIFSVKSHLGLLPFRIIKNQLNFEQIRTAPAFFGGPRNVSDFNNHLVLSTKNWVNRVVIGEKLCPFAPPLIESNTIRIFASAAKSDAEAAEDIKVELNLLLRPSLTNQGLDDDVNKKAPQNNAVMINEENMRFMTSPSHQTTLVVFDGPFVQDFREFVRLSWMLQSEAVVAGGLVNDVQLVLFHPKATHQTYSTDISSGTAADFTIRSPYPLIHLLREVDVMKAVSGRYPHLEDLSSRNKQRFLAQGYTVCNNRLSECYSRKQNWRK
jgi:uncharacterized protein